MIYALWHCRPTLEILAVNFCVYNAPCLQARTTCDVCLAIRLTKVKLLPCKYIATALIVGRIGNTEAAED